MKSILLFAMVFVGCGVTSMDCDREIEELYPNRPCMSAEVKHSRTKIYYFPETGEYRSCSYDKFSTSIHTVGFSVMRKTSNNVKEDFGNCH